ncbi:TomO hydrophobic C-terminal domain-containing protein [Wolbachia endosymbiont of Mansonella perstans]|uniref:TomO hydrophobic C-terminal domain-containing protein n=1 Tax=Wolbachia endosymbiont of Mansonella perstans TaxID=229526 RepID=UPI001CE05317|nr:hypothetical protein [Wolbachia endosymbiont of Mansonella perstans]MCA4774423.1 hypothetical protein [Wolbachia endosymbiont of Mansonella perstans]
MFRKVVQDSTNAATNPVWLGSSQQNLPQREPTSPSSHESNDRNVAGLSYKKGITKVQHLETFSTQYIGILKFLLGKIPAGGSSGIAKPSLEGDVQFKKLRDIARLNPALRYSKNQSASFGASQQTVKNILAEGEKSDILSRVWDLMENPISRSSREDKMHVSRNEQYIENLQEEQLQDKNELKDRIKESNNQATKPTEEKNQLDKDLNSAKQSLNKKDKKLENKNKESESKAQELEALKSANESQIKDLQKQLQSKSELESQIKGLQAKLKSKDEELKNKTQQLKALEDENNNLKIKLQEFENKNKELESKAQELEALKSANESQIKDLQKQLQSRNKELKDSQDRKPLVVNVQGVKGKVNYAYASFILSGVSAVGASLATPYLVICTTLAVAASVFLALGCYYLYKANTALSNVKVDQQDNQRLLESSL